MTEPYHRFVFDLEQRRFVGDFDEMYRREAEEGYDSWHQDEMDTLARRVALSMLAERRWSSVLDVGCGKGAFTALLKTSSNRVVGIDISPSAIEVARERASDVEFRVLEAERAAGLGERFEVATVIETLSYLEDWRGALDQISRVADWLFVSLYLPPDPIGFVKTFDDLRDAVEETFALESEVLVNREQLMLLAGPR